MDKIAAPSLPSAPILIPDEGPFRLSSKRRITFHTLAVYEPVVPINVFLANEIL